jgi:hypothetical protein
MALGRIKCVENVGRRFGSSGKYLFVKVQADYGAEEYWLLTNAERRKFAGRAAKNTEDVKHARRGVYTVVPNRERTFGSSNCYYTLTVEDEAWMLTDSDLERIRTRVESNIEDIEANREGWLADLLD